MRPLGRALSLLAALALAPASLRAWGSATHQWITREALARVADDPAVAPLARDPRLRQALLGGSVAPDMMLALVADPRNRRNRDGLIAAHQVFKDRRFGEALLERARTGEAWASALGFLCHHLHDEDGDGDDGYPDRKPSVPYQTALFNELMLDLLVLAEPDPPRATIQVDVATLVAATKEFGAPLTAQEVRRAVPLFAATRAVVRGFLRALADQHAGAFLDSLGAYYADARTGLPGEGPGLEELVRRTAALIQREARARPAWLTLVHGASEPPGPDLDQELEAVVYELLRGTQPLLGRTGLGVEALALLQWPGVHPLYPLQFLVHLWSTPEATFPAFLERSGVDVRAWMHERHRRRIAWAQQARAGARAPQVAARRRP